MKKIRMYASNKKNTSLIAYSTVCERLISNVMLHTAEFNNHCEIIYLYSVEKGKYGEIDEITITNVGDDDYMVCATNYSLECTTASLKRALNEIVENVVNEFFNEISETTVENETTETLVITDENENTYTTDEMFETIDNIENHNVKTFKVGDGRNSIIIRVIGNDVVCLMLWDNINDKIIDYVEFFSIEYKKTFKKWLKYID